MCDSRSDVPDIWHRDPWYAVRVKPRHEKSVASVLHNKGFEEFLPLYRARHRWSDRRVDVQLPLFPGYLFCRPAAGNWLPILTTPGVLGMVGIGRRPVAVEDHEIEAIHVILRSGLAARPWPLPGVGERVVIEEGPLAGLEGVLIAVRKSHRLVVSVNLLRRAVAVEINHTWVRSAAGQRAPHLNRDSLRTPRGGCSPNVGPMYVCTTTSA